MHRRSRVLIALSATIPIALIAALIWAPPLYSVLTELDINSGGRRSTGRVLGLAVWTDHEDRAIPRLLKESNQVLGPPDWHRCHYRALFDPIRINYVHGSTNATLRSLEGWFETTEIPPPDQIRLARAALQTVVEDPRRSLAVQLTESGGIELRSGDSTIATWNPAKP